MFLQRVFEKKEEKGESEMRPRVSVNCFAVSFLALVLVAFDAIGQTNRFAYQGRLTDGAFAANGTYEMQFKLFDVAALGTQQGATITNSAVSVVNGTFTVQLDFSPATPFATGADRWLEVAVRKAADSPGFTILSPRQQIISNPFSIRSVSASASDALSATCVLCVTDAHIVAVDGSKVTGTVANSTNAQNALTVSGIVGIANGGTGSKSQNFVDLTTNQTIEGYKSFTGTVEVTGKNGVFTGNGSGLTNLNGANIAPNSIDASALSSNALPNSRNLSLLGMRRWDLLFQRISVGNSNNIIGDLAFDGSNIWATNPSANNVTKIRVSDGAIQGVFNVGTYPSAIAYDGANIWVVNKLSSTITKLRAIDGTILDTIAVASQPGAIAFDGVNIWITHELQTFVTKIRASDGASQGVFSVGETGSFAIAFDGTYIWIAMYYPGRVRKLRASDGQQVGNFPAGGQPTGIAFDGSHIWIANPLSSSLTKLDPATGANLGTINTGGGPIGVAFDGTNIWVPMGDGVRKIRVGDLTNLGNFPVESMAGIAFDGMNIWVAGVGCVTKIPVFN